MNVPVHINMNINIACTSIYLTFHPLHKDLAASTACTLSAVLPSLLSSCAEPPDR